MTIEVLLVLMSVAILILLAAHARYALPEVPSALETVDVGHIAVQPPPPPPEPRDILDDFAAELGFEALTVESSAEHRLALLEALLEEADHETVRLEVLVNKLGIQLVPAA